MKECQKLLDFAKLIGVNAVVHATNFEMGTAENMYLFPQKIIVINEELLLKEKIITLAHEIGHFINRSKHESELILAEEALRIRDSFPDTNVYFEYFNKGLMRKEKILINDAILNEEILAWKEAENVLNFLKVKYDKNLFKKDKKLSLKSYNFRKKEKKTKTINLEVL